MKVRRRILMLGGPALFVTSTATVALIAEQHARRSPATPHGLGHLMTDVALIAFTIAFVASPLVGAARTARAIPSLVAVIAGPIITPRLFGAGGWRWWETLVVIAVTAAISSAALQRRAPRRRRASSVPS